MMACRRRPLGGNDGRGVVGGRGILAAIGDIVRLTTYLLFIPLSINGRVTHQGHLSPSSSSFLFFLFLFFLFLFLLLFFFLFLFFFVFFLFLFLFFLFFFFSFPFPYNSPYPSTCPSPSPTSSISQRNCPLAVGKRSSH